LLAVPKGLLCVIEHILRRKVRLVEDPGFEKLSSGYPGTDDPDATDPGVGIPPFADVATAPADPGAEEAGDAEDTGYGNAEEADPAPPRA
jgi:hypothetical protein